MSKTTDRTLSISELWHLCTARWRWFVASVLLCLIVAVRYLLTTPYVYSRSASIIVREEFLGNNATEKNGKDFSQIGFVNQKSNVTDVARHITSLDVLLEVASRLDSTLTEEEIFNNALGIQSRLSAEVEGIGSNIINLTYKDFSTREAARGLALIMDVYNDKWFMDKQRVTRSTSLFIDSRLRLLESDLNLVDDSISSFKSRYGITDLNRVSDIYLQQQSQADAEILRLMNQKAMAEYIRSLLEDDSSQKQLLLVNSGINNSLIESQITLYNSLLLQMQSHLEYTSGQNPLIVNLEKELKSLRKNILSNVINHIRTIDIQLQSLESYHGQTASKISSNPNQEKHLISIEREQKVKESLYLYLLQKKEENEISITYKVAPTQVIDIPNGSGKPTSPKRVRVLLAAVLIGFMLPVIVIFLRATMDETVRDRYDIERRGGIPFLGEVPLLERRSTIRSLQRRFGLRPARSSLVVTHGGQGPVNEALRLIRTKLESVSEHEGNGNKVYMVTSSQEGTGKTFVSMNLALVLAIAGWRVLFIDGDLRKGSASRRWQALGAGLTDYLDGDVVDVASLLVHPKDYPTLDVLPAGTIPTNPTELLRGSLFANLMESMRLQYDFILIDTPPTGSLADAEIIRQNTDLSLFIVRTGKFERQYLDDLKVPDSAAISQYVILNGTSIGSRYGYAYGHEYEHHGKGLVFRNLLSKLFKKQS